MERIKLGQIGIGHNHGGAKMSAARKFPELFDVIGFAEEDAAWIEKRGEMSCYKDLPRMSEEELLAKCDAILVETDVWNLTKTARRCIDAGKHVHLDKPASGTLEEYADLLAAAKAQNLTVQLGYMYRYNYAVTRLMEMIRRGELGEIYQIDAEMSTFHSNDYRTWLQHFKGGSMYIFGSHLIDLIIRILGEPKNVYPFIKQTGFEGVFSDDNGFAVLEYEKAVARVTTLSVEHNGWGMRRFAVMGSGGTVEIKPMELDLVMTKSTPDAPANPYKECSERIDVPDIVGGIRYDGLMKDFHASITGAKPNPYDYDYEYLVQKTLYRVTGEN